MIKGYRLTLMTYVSSKSVLRVKYLIKNMNSITKTNQKNIFIHILFRTFKDNADNKAKCGSLIRKV